MGLAKKFPKKRDQDPYLMSSLAQSALFNSRLLRVYVCVFGALALFEYPAAAGKGPKDVSIKEMAPLQTDAGLAEAHDKAESWIAEANLRAKERGVPVRDELVKILNRKGSAGYTAYISPDGKYRPNDGHHKVIAAREIMKRFRIDPSEVKWSLNVEGDYRGESWEKFAREMERRGIGYFSKEVLEESAKRGESLGELYRRHLPDNFLEVHNSPMRSAIGRLFDILGIKGSAFNPYIQFFEGDLMEDAGVEVKSGEEFSPKTQTRLQSELFEGKLSRELQRTLLSKVLPERKAEIDAKLKAAKEQFVELRRSAADRPAAARLACMIKGIRAQMAASGLLSR